MKPFTRPYGLYYGCRGEQAELQDEGGSMAARASPWRVDAEHPATTRAKGAARAAMARMWAVIDEATSSRGDGDVSGDGVRGTGSDDDDAPTGASRRRSASAGGVA